MQTFIVARKQGGLHSGPHLSHATQPVSIRCDSTFWPAAFEACSCSCGTSLPETAPYVPCYSGVMDPAIIAPSDDVRRDIIHTVEVLCNEWLTGPCEEYKEAVADKL